MEDFEKQTEEENNPVEEVVKDMPGNDDGLHYIEDVIITKIS